MQMQPCTDMSQVLLAAGDARATVVLSFLPDAARALMKRLAPEDAPDARKALAARLERLNVRKVLWNDDMEKAQLAAEAGELLQRMRSPSALPLLLSGCAGWQRYVSTECAMLLACFSAFAPQAGHPWHAAPSRLSRQAGISSSGATLVLVASCEAQRERYGRLRGDPLAPDGREYIITVRELVLWLGLEHTLPAQKVGREQANEPTEGRLQRVLSMAQQMSGTSTGTEMRLELSPLEGRSAVRVGTARLGGRVLRCAQVRGLHEAQALLPALQSGEWHVDVLEVLACAGCR